MGISVKNAHFLTFVTLSRYPFLSILAPIMTNIVRHYRSTAAAVCAAVCLSLLLAPVPARAASPNLVISRVYGGGGSSGATYLNDYIEIFNRGGSPVSLDGLSLQYASSIGTGPFGGSSAPTTQLTVLPAVTLAPGQYFLVQEVAAGAAGIPLPSPDFIAPMISGVIGPINLSVSSGKVALVNSPVALGCNGGSIPCSAAQLALIIDLVGYGNSNFFEGSGAAPTLSLTTAAIRLNGGCTDTDNNNADFTAGSPLPRNMSSPINPCTAGLPISASGASSNMSVASGDPTLLTVRVSPATSPASTGVVVTADLSLIGGSSTVLFHDDGMNGDAIANDNTFSFAATIGATATLGGVSLHVSVKDDQLRTATTGIGLTLTPAGTALAIHEIQGNSAFSPWAGTLVHTTGVVTALKSNGFFVQSPDDSIDSDPNTSEAVFVFTSSARPAAAAIGNLVKVRGKVQDYIPTADPESPPMTEIISPTVILLGTGQPLPAFQTITADDVVSTGSMTQLQKYEGMRVHVDTLTVVGPTQGSINEAGATAISNGIFYGVFPGVARPHLEPGIEAPAPVPCCIPSFDGNPERLRVDTHGQIGSTAVDVTAGATVTNITGVLEYAYRTFSVVTDPSTPPSASGNIVAAIPVSAPGQHEVTVASANLERFFDTADDPATSDALPTAAAFNNRLAKYSLAIRNILLMPDILGVEEVENLSTLQALATLINNDAVAVGQPNPVYQAYLEEGNDIGGIDVGFLVKSSRIDVVDVVQLGKDATYASPISGAQEMLNDRPPLVLRANVKLSGKELALPLTVIVNHLRSLSGIDDLVDGPRVRAKRLAQAEFLANIIQGEQSSNPASNLISVGDYNATNVNDGYVDVMGAILGAPAPADQDVLPAPAGLVSPPLADLLILLSPDQQYSYVYDGNTQVLDHILVNTTASAKVSRFEYARNNADFPQSYYGDPTRPERYSDHDVPIAYFKVAVDDIPPVLTLPVEMTVEATSAAGADVSFTASALDLVDGTTAVTCTPISGSTFAMGTTAVTCNSTDAHDNTATGSFNIHVVDTTPPFVTVTGVSDGATYTLGAVPAAGCSTTDSVSGVAANASVVISGGAVNGAGPFTATCSGGMDNAGNTAAPVKVTYSVVYVFGGFIGLKTSGVNGGSTVPLKFQIGDAKGNLMTNTSAVKSIQAAFNKACAGKPDGELLPAGAAGGSSLRFDYSAGQFVFNWKTSSAFAGNCYSLVLNLTDGTAHTAIVSFK